MKSVVVALLLCAVLSLIDAQCFSQEYQQRVQFCQDSDDKTWHPVGSRWRNSKCVDCECNDNAMSCCNAIETPAQYPDTCQVHYDYTSCTFEVFEKIPCNYSGSVL